MSKKSTHRPASPITGLQSRTLHVTVEPNIKAEAVHAALDKIFEMNGCTVCGLNGLEVRWRVRDPLTEVFKGIEGIAAIDRQGF